MECEVCGRKALLIQTKVEGAILSVCPQCAKRGKVLDIPETVVKKERTNGLEAVEMVYDFKAVVKNARLAAGMSVEELGTRINEKAAVLRRIEGGMRPTIPLAKKLERFFKIKIMDVS
jgi:uncharacterized protein (TIGR00270 family)